MDDRRHRPGTTILPLEPVAQSACRDTLPDVRVIVVLMPPSGARLPWSQARTVGNHRAVVPPDLAPRRRWRHWGPSGGSRPPACGVDRRAIRSCRACLHAGHVGQRDVRLEHLLGHHHPQGRIELRRTARQQCGLVLPEPGAPATPKNKCTTSAPLYATSRTQSAEASGCSRLRPGRS